MHVCLISAAKEKGIPVTVVYVPSHLYHMIFELFKVGSGVMSLVLLINISVCFRISVVNVN